MAAQAIRYYRRQKISAYQHMFFLDDGTKLAETFNDIQPAIDFSPARWYEADSNIEVTDLSLIARLNEAAAKVV